MQFKVTCDKVIGIEDNFQHLMDIIISCDIVIFYPEHCKQRLLPSKVRGRGHPVFHPLQ